VVEGAKWECDYAIIYHDIRPQWNIPYTIEIKGDTIIEDVAYKCCVYTFEESTWNWEEYTDYSPADTLTLAFIREDVENKKVYARFNDSVWHGVYCGYSIYSKDMGSYKDFLLYDFANINNPDQAWRRFKFESLIVNAEKIIIDGVERNCYTIGNGEGGYIIEGIGYDGYGFIQNAGDLMCQFPALVTGTDVHPVFKAYKNAEGKTVYNTGDAANNKTTDYVPLVVEGAKWECDYATFHHDMRPDWFIPYTIEIKGDTIIEDVAYKCCVYTFEESTWNWEEYTDYSPADTLTLAFIREDVENKKVYARFNNTLWHGVYCQNYVYYEDMGDFLLYDFDDINNPDQAWQKTVHSYSSPTVNAGKITIDGVERNCYSIGNGNAGYIIEGIGYDGYGFNQNAGDLMCQFPAFVTGIDDLPVFKAYKNAGGKTVYNTGDAAKGFSGIYGIATDNEESIFHIANGTIAVNGEALIEIIDLNGRKVASAYCDSFSTETLPKGMYIIRATTQSTTQTHKVIVK